MYSRFAAVLLTILPPGTLEAQPPPPMPRDRPPVRADGTAVLKGRVVDGLTAAAIPRARVRLFGRGIKRPLATTDVGGAFEFTRLPAGPYSLQAEKSGYLSGRHPNGRTMRARAKPIVLLEGQALEDVTIQMFRASAISGRVVDAHGDPVEFAQVQVLRVVPGQRPALRGGLPTNDIGEFRVGRLEPGSYLLLASAQRMGRREEPDSTEPSAAPLPTYYPGVLSIDQAQPITLERGESATGIELALGEGATTIVTGTMVMADGQRVTNNGWVNARLLHGPARMDAGGEGVRPDGTFRVELPPGEYLLEGHAMQTPRGKEPQREHERVGMLRLTVGGSPVESVILVLGNPAVVTGRVVFEGTTPPPSPPKTPVWLPLNRDEDERCQSQQAHVNADWTFRVEGLLGTCSAPNQQMFGKWMLKSVTVNGEEMLTRPMTFEPGQQLRNVQVVLTDRRSTMALRVADDAGQSTREYVALVFFADRRRWQKGPLARTYVPPQVSVDMTAPGPGALPSAAPGLFAARPERIEPLAPGEYYVVAVDDVEPEALRSEDLFERLIPSAMRVSVTEGASLEVALRRVKLRDGR